ncbi:hypothetical protein O2K51_04675 [Apibacter raozihei]|uniref:hypothetical protein n=1 Tax=Apibacter raozihei TaxID=2500547 RepID=UPI000FE427EF|nr:hypothetical protein [Apibacter raozihei]
MADLLKKAGFTTVKGNFDADGILAFEDSLRYHLLTNKYSAGERMLHLFTLGHNERLVDGKIDLKIMINGEFNKEFNFLKIQNSIEGKVDFDLNEEAGLKLRYGTSPQKGLFMELILIFSGIKETFSGNLKSKSRWEILNIDYSPNKGEPIPFIMFEAKEYSLCKIYLFDPNP